jgi:hypothetical protein
MAASEAPAPSALQKCHVVHAPEPFTPKGKSVFLAGIIDKEKPTWRESVISRLSHLDITILDPLRSDWGNGWTDDISCEPFREQTTWELNMLEASTVVAMYMGPSEGAPIALLEFGLFARSGKMIVACPKGFYRRGNGEWLQSRSLLFICSLELEDIAEVHDLSRSCWIHLDSYVSLIHRLL